MDVDKSLDGEGKDGKDTKDVHPPAKKYKMTEAMKGLIWNLVCLSNECCRIENEKKCVQGFRTVKCLANPSVQHARRLNIPSERTGLA